MPSRPDDVDFDEDQLEAELDWEADCIGRISRRDPATGVDMIEELSKRRAAKIGRPPPRRSGATPTPTPSPPPAPDPAAGPLSSELELPPDPAEQSGRAKMRELMAKRRQPQT